MDMQSLMKQAGQMQSKMNELKEVIAQITAKGSSGGGLVTCEIDGKGFATSLEISDELLKEEKNMITDLVIASFNNAKENQEAEIKKVTNEFTSSLGLPAGMLPPGL